MTWYTCLAGTSTGGGGGTTAVASCSNSGTGWC